MTLADVAASLGALATTNAPLGPLTTYRVGGPAALLVEVNDERTLELVAGAVGSTGTPVLVVGRGSNLLVADRGFPGVALRMGDGLADIAVEGHLVRAGGALSLPVLARRTAAAGLTGLEWAVGVPGSVGGAVRMNAGGHGSQAADTLVSARIVDLDSGEGRTVPAAGLDLGYRHSAVGERHVVVEATFALEEGDRAAAEERIAEIVRWRRQHQPGGQNAGSVFTNPAGDSAGRLIEAAGLKGFRLGSAYVSPKHANFFQADEGGSADDVRTLILEVQRRVGDATGVQLVPELRMIGFDDHEPRVEVEG